MIRNESLDRAPERVHRSNRRAIRRGPYLRSVGMAKSFPRRAVPRPRLVLFPAKPIPLPLYTKKHMQGLQDDRGPPKHSHAAEPVRVVPRKWCGTKGTGLGTLCALYDSQAPAKHKRIRALQ